MKKSRHIRFFGSGNILARKCAAVFSASLFAFSSAVCAFQIEAQNEDAPPMLSADISSREMILELSESYLSPKTDNSISVIELSYVNEKPEIESESLNLIEEISSETKTVAETTEAPTEKKTETTTAQIPVKAVETTQAQTSAVVEALSPDGNTFSQLGISQMSDIKVPDSIKFSADGIPLNYSYKLSGRATAYNMGTTTATGTSVHPGVVAVNPRIIPYGSKMYIVAADGSGIVYGYSSAEDTGGFIYWNNAPLVDMYVYSYNDACMWGNRPVTVYVF